MKYPLSRTDPAFRLGDLIPIDEFLESCQEGLFTDYDGHGYPVRDENFTRDFRVYPSTRHDIPKDATHVLWFNR